MKCPKCTTGGGPCYCQGSSYYQHMMGGRPRTHAAQDASFEQIGKINDYDLLLQAYAFAGQLEDEIETARTARDELASWAHRAAQELQDFCDEAQEAAGNPEGEDQLPSVRALVAEFNAISQGRPTWQAKLAHEDPGAADELII